MKTFETSATVQDRGEVRVAGVPFAPGTEVEVTISAKSPSRAAAADAAGAASPARGGLRWQGNVLVHDGAGTAPSLAELRDERLRHVGGG